MRHVLPVIVMTIALACVDSDVTITPPRVPQAGRAVAIAVAQTNAKRIIVASESGGLFRTFDGGKSFHHLNGFPTYGPIDVAIASLDPNTVIVTARDDFATVSGGGIWRSTDGGGTWARPAGWPPAMGPTCGARPVARGISHMPLTRTFYVATDCGIAVSVDNGASFSMVVLDPATPTVRGVLVLNRTTGVAADDVRLWFLNGGTWQQATGGPTTRGEHNLQNFASPSWTGLPIFYHAGRDRELYFSTNAGANWELMVTPAADVNREKHVEVGRGLDGDPTHFDVYFGDGTDLRRQAVTTVIPGGSNAWQTPVLEHVDPSDIAFTPGREVPLMLATDGGVHITSDSGRTWKLTGSHYGGFTALQIGEVTGRRIGGGTPHLDLYYSTQDNGIRSSSDGGQTWPGSVGGEGAFIGADAANPAPVDGPVTGRKCGGCAIFQAPSHFDAPAEFFRSAPDGSMPGSANAPAQILGAAYLQSVPATGPPASFNFFFTGDQGTTWTPSFSVPDEPLGIARFAGPLANPVAYVGVKRGSKFGIFRIQNVVTLGTVRRADSTGFGSVGVLGTGQGRYAVYGVNPANPNQLIAADVDADMMKASRDGGLTWFPLPALNEAVTDSARFLFKQDIASFATVIAWDPTNTCHILVGTMQNGVIRSSDGGLTWRRIAGSKIVPWVTSFFFPPTGSIWMSSYGRGLWTIGVDRTRPAGGRCAFPPMPGTWAPFDSLVVVARGTRTPRPFSGLNDSIVCETCTVLSTRKGWITDVATEGNVVTNVGISSGMVFERDRTGKEVPLSVSNSYAANESERLRRLLGRGAVSGRRVRAIVLREKRLVALVHSRDELPWPLARNPMVYVVNAAKAGVPSIVQPGDSAAVHGYGFLPGTGTTGVSIVIGADTVASGVRVQANGTFMVKVPVVRAFQELEVSAVQRDGARLTVERGSITVVPREER